ncbi:hypothetical protein Syun_027798 [Stephania yunnanensis]|uniref:Uncharacterized protein n=1 Tax=Stephania yunnanensis TaxID=152371 RepID=A0AAP0EJK3_9MAGN
MECGGCDEAMASGPRRQATGRPRRGGRPSREVPGWRVRKEFRVPVRGISTREERERERVEHEGSSRVRKTGESEPERERKRFLIWKSTNSDGE